MRSIQLKVIFHQAKRHLGIYFPPDDDIELTVRKIEGIKWSQTHRCWYIPFLKETYEVLKCDLERIDGVKVALLQDNLEQKASAPNQKGNFSFKRGPQKGATNVRISSENEVELTRLEKQLTLKGYSPSTIKTYKNEFKQLLELLGKKQVCTLESEDLRRYLLFALEK